MATRFKIFALAMALLLSSSGYGYAQYVYPQGYPRHGQPGSHGHYPYPTQAEAVHELYHRNAQKPLRGLFADGFTRTLTVLGGAQFLNSIKTDDNLLGSVASTDGITRSLESETGYALSFAFGRRHNHRLRSEIELAVRQNDTSFEFEPTAIDDVLNVAPQSTDDDNVRAYSIMKNFMTGFENTSRITPYLGAGLGWSYIDLAAPSVGIDDGGGAFSYQAIGGVSTTISNAADFVVEYRFLGTTEIDVDGFENPITYRSHNLFLGVKFEY